MSFEIDYVQECENCYTNGHIDCVYHDCSPEAPCEKPECPHCHFKDW